MGVHNFKHTQAIVAGNIITGFADGDAISAEPNEDKWSQTVGADGNVTYNESNNDTGTFTLKLKPESASVPVLLQLYKSGESFDVMLHDTTLNKRVTGEDCRIQKLPPFTRAEEVEALEYVILAAHYKED
ncbi:phage structural protein [Lysinibacillus fusiformis]|uniref:phage structural protein n=1 Tax=Lysinibacillus fusiformis TaxID=28031 RepID=UPI00380FAB14